MSNPRDVLNLGVSIGSRNIAVGAIPESAPTGASDGYPVTVTLPSGITVTPPNVAVLVDFEGGTTPTATLAVYGYFPEESPELLSAWQKLLESEVSEAVNPYLKFFAVGAKRVHVLVQSVTGSPTSIRLGLRGVTGPLSEGGDDVSSPPSPHSDTHIHGESDEIDGDKLDIDYLPTNYVIDTSPAEVDDTEHLTAHLAGIDNHLATGNVVVDANCLSSDNEDDLVYITASMVGGRIQVTKADPYDDDKMPAMGIIISKSSSTVCRVQLAGLVTSISGLTPGRYYFVSSSGLSLTDPASPGERHAQVMGMSLSSNVFWLQPDKLFVTLI